MEYAKYTKFRWEAFGLRFKVSGFFSWGAGNGMLFGNELPFFAVNRTRLRVIGGFAPENLTRPYASEAVRERPDEQRGCEFLVFESVQRRYWAVLNESQPLEMLFLHTKGAEFAIGERYLLTVDF